MDLPSGRDGKWQASDNRASQPIPSLRTIFGQTSVLSKKTKSKVGDVILSMNGYSVCGSGTGWPYYLMHKLWKAWVVLTVQVVSQEVLDFCIEIPRFLNDARFCKSTIHHAIQLHIRRNLYSLSVPVTNRPSRKDDQAPDQGGYFFIDNEQLVRWLDRNYFLEGGVYQGSCTRSETLLCSACNFAHLRHVYVTKPKKPVQADDVW